MIGTEHPNPDLLAQHCHSIKTTVQSLRQMGRHGRKMIGFNSHGKLSTRIKKIQRCLELAKQFKPISRDEDDTREVKATNGQVLELPLVWSIDLPASNWKRIQKTVGRRRFEAKSRTPAPTPEAFEALKEHKHLFDRCQVWWVPQDILVKEIPEPDPVLVGVIDIPASTDYRSRMEYGFEIYRWIDESVEDSYWFREGY